MVRFLLLAAAMCLALPALGDVIHLKNGSTLEGQVSPAPHGVLLKLPVGEMTISNDAIDRIEKKEAPLDEYQKRAAALKEGDAEAHYQLAVWAFTAGLKPQAREQFRQTLALNPDHAAARQALGYRMVDGRWMTEDEEMQARGLIKYEGQWMPPDAAARLQALKAELEVAREKRLAAETELRRAQEQTRAAQPPPPVYPPYPYYDYSYPGFRMFRYMPPAYPALPLPHYYSPFGNWWFYPGGRRFVPYWHR